MTLRFVVAGFLLAACGGAGADSSPEGGGVPVETSRPDPDDVARSEGKFALCNDGGYSDNEDFSATCSGGDGIDRWLADFGECNDGRVIPIAETSNCRDNDGFGRLLAVDYVPEPRTGDVALCEDGTYSDNTKFNGTCSSSDGVAEWLAEFVECNDGDVFALSSSTSCGDAGFKRLVPNGEEIEAADGDVARCNDGTFSDNTDFSATCSSADGVDAWLADYVECGDGTVVELNAEARCNDGVSGLRPDYSPSATTTSPPAKTTTTTAPPTEPESTALPTVPAALEILTVENSEDLAALLAGPGSCDDAVAEFSTKYQGRLIEFDGNIAFLSNHDDYDTRFDFLIYGGDFNGETGNPGPSFQFEDVNFRELNFIGSNVPDEVSMGVNLRIVAEVEELTIGCLLRLDPVSTELR